MRNEALPSDSQKPLSSHFCICLPARFFLSTQWLSLLLCIPAKSGPYKAERFLSPQFESSNIWPGFFDFYFLISGSGLVWSSYPQVQSAILLLLLLNHFSHVWLCDPIDGRPPGSSIHWIFQARVLMWVAIAFSDNQLWARDKVGLPRWLSDKEPACQCRRHGFDSWVWKIPWRRKWQPTPVFLPGTSYEQRSLVGYNLWGSELDTT